MTMIFPVLMVVIFVAVAVSLYTEGLWGNALRLIDVVTAALLAINFFEPLANLLEKILPSCAYLWDYIAIWLVFGVSLGVLHTLTDLVSKVKISFLKIVDQVGSGILACCVAAVMVSFVATTMHTAPLGEKFLFGGFQSDQPIMGGLAPDRKLLGFASTVSRGAFCHSPANPLDPQSFVARYKQRRIEIGNHVRSTGNITR
jgi:hypothetical protein